MEKCGYKWPRGVLAKNVPSDSPRRYIAKTLLAFAAEMDARFS